MIIENLKNVLNMMRKDNERELEYHNGIGITTLLYCPLKAEYRRLHPEMRAQNVAIDDGFLFERTFIPYLEKEFGGKVLHEPAIEFVIGDTKITGHPDIVIEHDDHITILEFKAPISIYPSQKDTELPDDDIILDTEGIFNIAEHYIQQARIQKRIVREFYQKPVDAYLFIKSTIQQQRRKVYILRPIHDEISDDELLQLIDSFKNKKEPRYSWECQYCIYSNVCDRTQNR